MFSVQLSQGLFKDHPYHYLALPLLFLDEPVSGLHISAVSNVVCECHLLNHLFCTTMIVTVYQPREVVVDMADTSFLLSAGSCAKYYRQLYVKMSIQTSRSTSLGISISEN